MSDLQLEMLPPLPQCRMLAELAPILWSDPNVLAIWLGGSLAHGNADLYSDVDLRLAVIPEALEGWKTPNFTALFREECLAHLFLPFGEPAFLHHIVFRNGDIYDLWIQSAAQDPSADSVLLLGCRDESLRQRLQRSTTPAVVRPYPAKPEEIRQLLVEFWIGTHKHRKVLYRGLDLLATTGIQLERSLLLRLWYVANTGQDFGPARPTIHGMTELSRTVQHVQGTVAFQVLGAPLTNRAQICHAIELLRDSVSEAGRRLAQTLNFAYPHDLEQMVRQGWSDFLF